MRAVFPPVLVAVAELSPMLPTYLLLRSESSTLPVSHARSFSLPCTVSAVKKTKANTRSASLWSMFLCHLRGDLTGENILRWPFYVADEHTASYFEFSLSVR